MNKDDTSASFSLSPLLYYHLARFFDTKVDVPVAVYREMDREMHLQRVTINGVEKAEDGMNKAAWTHLYNTESSLTNDYYNPVSDLLTSNLMKIHGVLVDDKGSPYRSEFNGTRESEWGLGHNLEMQQTAPFIALRSPLPLEKAITESISEANKNPKMKIDLINVSSLQMIYWMRELIEITLLDYIFNQQDRNENIDYEWYWYFIKDSKVTKEKEKRPDYDYFAREFMNDIPVPEDLKMYNPTLIQRSAINDNDAGGRIQYINFTKESKMLDNLYHYSSKLFKKLMKLDKDFKAKGLIYQWLKSNFPLDSDQFNLIITNTHEAALKLKEQCKNIVFDLDEPDDFLIDGVIINDINCDQY